MLLSQRTAQYLNKQLEWGHSFKPMFACLETVTPEHCSNLLLLRKETELKNLLSNETLLLCLNKEKFQKKKKAEIPYPISEGKKDLCFITADAPYTQHLPEIGGKSPVKV